MLTKDMSAELEAIFQQLQQQNKEPTLALVKARLTKPVPLPAIISAISRWKSNLQMLNVEITKNDLPHQSDRIRIEKLEQQVAELCQRVADLERNKKD